MSVASKRARVTKRIKRPMDKMCQWLVEIFDGKVVHNCGPDDYIHPAILDVVDSMVENYPVWVMIDSII